MANTRQEEYLRAIACGLEEAIRIAYGEPTRFFLTIFRFSEPAVTDYIGNAKLKDTIAAIRECADLLEKKATDEGDAR